MIRFLLIALQVLIIPGVLHAARVQCTLPKDFPEAYLLSGGTEAVLKHFRSQSEAETKKLRMEYQIDVIENQTKNVEALIKKKQQAYSDKVSMFRKNYLSLLEITIHSSQASINPSTSALGDVSYFFTAKNNSDKIITDITYKPIIEGKKLPTTTSLVLEFIDPQTLKSGLGPHETMSNLGHDPEKFSFFIGEISQEELKKIQSDFGKKFDITIMDMHFAPQKGYKGQIKPLTFDEAFSGQLRAMGIAVEEEEREAKAKKNSYANALKQFTEQQNRINGSLEKTLGYLKKTSIRYTAQPDKKGRYIFEDVPEGTYFVYAGNGKKAAFEKVTIRGKKQKESITKLKKDPFAP